MSITHPPYVSPWRWLRRSAAAPESSSRPIGGGLRWSAAVFLLGFPLLLLADRAAAQPVITISADTARVTEGTDAIFRIEASQAPTAHLTLSVEVADSGSFVSSDGIGTGTEEVLLLKGHTALTLAVSTTDDNRAEAHGTITVTVRPGSYTVGTPSEAVVRVSDNDITADVFLLGATPLSEGGRFYFSIRLSKALDGNQTVTLPLAIGGTATRGTDYRLVCETSTLATCNGIDGATPSITFHGEELNKRARSAAQNVSSVVWFEAIEDNTAESNETVTLSLGGRSTTITLQDAPSSVTLAFRQGNYSTSERSEALEPTLVVDTAPGQNITVPLVFTAITATEGEDYLVQLGEGDDTFYANGSTVQAINIPVVDDNVVEEDETYRVEIDASKLPSWVTVGSQASAVMTIVDDDRVVTISANRARVTEGTSAEFTVSASPAPTQPFDVTVQVTDSGNFAASGTGFQEVTVGTDGSGTLTVTTTDDNTAEAHGTLTATVQFGSGNYTIGTPSEAVVRVSDDDITADPIMLGGTPLSEGGRFAFSLFLSKALDGDQTLTLPLALGGTATRGTDYRLVCGEFTTLITCNGLNGATPSLTFHGEGFNKRSSINTARLGNALWFEAIEDDTAESNETVTLSLGGRSVTVTLQDAPSSVTLAFRQANYSAYENGRFLQPTLEVDAAPGQDITVPLIFNNITATEGRDYEAVATVTFHANGNTVNSFTIKLLDDNVYEGDETFLLRIDTSKLPSWVTVGSQGSAVATIRDNEQPIVTISADTARVTEGTSAEFTVSTSPAPPQSFTVTVEVTDSGSFAASGTGTQQVTVGTDGSGTLTVTTTDDNTEEAHGTITATLSSGAYDIGTPSEAVVRVSDNDITVDTIALNGATPLPEGRAHPSQYSSE